MLNLMKIFDDTFRKVYLRIYICIYMNDSINSAVFSKGPINTSWNQRKITQEHKEGLIKHCLYRCI